MAKVILVFAGYIIAAAVATAAVLCHLLAIGGPSSPAYSGMNAFGDGLLFLAVFGLAALPPTGAALYFLRPYPAFWRRFSVVACVFAFTSLVAFIVVTIDVRSVTAGLAFARILVSPWFSLIFLVTGCVAPKGASRMPFFVATGMEVMGFACWLLSCILRNY